MSSIFMSPFLIPVVAIVGVFGWLCIHSVMNAIENIAKHRQDVELKQLLADRGMSAEEIEQVVQASKTDSPDNGQSSPYRRKSA